MEEKEVVFDLKNVSKEYGQGISLVRALDEINIKIYKGEMVCILGGSGSGKSTFLNMIGGLDKPTSGDVFYKNSNIASFSSNYQVLYRRYKIGFIFQFFNLLDELTIYQNLTFIPGSYKNKEDIEKLLSSMGLCNALRKYPRELSGGQQQMVSIARALNKPSEVILADEPTGALDIKTGKNILTIFENMHKENKYTILIVTHNPDIAKMCDRIITMKSGKIISDEINKNVMKVNDIQW